MRLLVAETDCALGEFLQSGLQQEDFTVQLISHSDQLFAFPEDVSFDLVLLDVNLPGISTGDPFLDIRRRWPDAPIILLLSAETAVEERVRGLNAGADDFVVKPFIFSELVARVHAVLRRCNHPARDVLLFEDLEINRVSHAVRRAGCAIDLSPKEYALLEFLLRHPGRPVSRNSIIEGVWRMKGNSMTNVVDVYINYLRRKIDTASDHPLIRTIRGVGYQIGGNHVSS